VLHRALFAVCLILVTVTPLASPPLALLLGAVIGLSVKHPFPEKSRKLSRTLLQLSVVGLGFAMDLGQVLRAGASGFVYTLAGITMTLALGMALARLLRVAPRPAYLISVGTAICGGSAIAAVGPVTQASDEEMSVSIGTVFLLNALGLLLFPPLGIALGLTESQFGLWAALAIHDTSSVVGAGARYGALALAIATTVKLARALWIVPLTLATAVWLRRRGAAAKAKIDWPWFVLFFLLAAVVNTYASAGQPAYDVLAHAARIGLTVTLFLIGTGITRASLKRLGARPLALGVVLWVVVATLTLAAVRAGWIAI
jgi:uncharacterized integral membrane protein (TIGR00698 family)